MGYTHYYITKKTLASPKKWEEFCKDVKKIFKYSQKELGIKLANGQGDLGSSPIIGPKFISFNGSEEQPKGVWTTTEEVSIPWPSDTAFTNDPNPDPAGEKTAGHWHAGTLLKQRVAPLNDETGLGSGSYETLYLARVSNKNDMEYEKDTYFNSCKTAFRPYDLVVTAVLIAAKHHFEDKIEVKSDGQDGNWIDAKFLCMRLFGYGMEYNIIKKEGAGRFLIKDEIK